MFALSASRTGLKFSEDPDAGDAIVLSLDSTIQTRKTLGKALTFDGTQDVDKLFVAEVADNWIHRYVPRCV